MVVLQPHLRVYFHHPLQNMSLPTIGHYLTIGKLEKLRILDNCENYKNWTQFGSTLFYSHVQYFIFQLVNIIHQVKISISSTLCFWSLSPISVQLYGVGLPFVWAEGLPTFPVHLYCFGNGFCGFFLQK